MRVVLCPPPPDPAPLRLLAREAFCLLGPRLALRTRWRVYAAGTGQVVYELAPPGAVRFLVEERLGVVGGERGAGPRWRVTVVVRVRVRPSKPGPPGA